MPRSNNYILKDRLLKMDKSIKSLNEYIDKVNEINEAWFGNNSTVSAWFRGQSDERWSLVPSIYRSQISSTYEREMVRDFKLRAKALAKHIPDNDIEWMILMQHYSLPTRLIDWSEGYLLALYFAVSNYKTDRDSAVWILDPWSLNLESIKYKSIPTSSSETLKDHTLIDDDNIKNGYVQRKVKAQLPVAFRPARLNDRIIAQRGVFTIHGHYNDGLDLKTNIKVKKIVIDRNSKINIFRELYLAGISHSTINPDIDGLSKEIMYRYSNDYMEGCNNNWNFINIR